jgi:hypothetical protein
MLSDEYQREFAAGGARTLAQAAKLIPGRGRSHSAPSTVWKWVTKGHQGVFLEAVRERGRRGPLVNDRPGRGPVLGGPARHGESAGSDPGWPARSRGERLGSRGARTRRVLDVLAVAHLLGWN